MQFVELAPTWICSYSSDFSNSFECVSDANKVSSGDTRVNFCHPKDSQPLYHKRDDSNSLSLHNWIEDLDLACSKQGPTGPIALLGSLQFVGWAISAFITPRLSDIYGRKIIFLVSMLIQFVALLGVFISRNWILTAAFIFIFGTGGVGRSSISYLLMQEYLPSNR
jgi:MFS family permease